MQQQVDVGGAQGVAVGISLSQSLHADQAGITGLVVHHEGVFAVKAGRHVQQRAHGHIGVAAGAEGNDHIHIFGGIAGSGVIVGIAAVVSLAAAGHQGGHQHHDRENDRKCFFHVGSSLLKK